MRGAWPWGEGAVKRIIVKLSEGLIISRANVAIIVISTQKQDLLFNCDPMDLVPSYFYPIFSAQRFLLECIVS